MSEQPRLTVDNYGTFAEEYDNYFNDQLPFQNNLIKLNSLIDYFVFDRSANSNESYFRYSNTYSYEDFAEQHPDVYVYETVERLAYTLKDFSIQ